MYTNVYKTTDMQVISQSDLEAKTLIKSASKLNAIKSNISAFKQSDIIDTLENNRKLWTVLSSELADADHPLPHDVRQNIANLAYFIFKHTVKLIAQTEIKASDLNILIEINMNVAKGLSHGRRTAEAAAKGEEAPVDNIPGLSEQGTPPKGPTDQKA